MSLLIAFLASLAVQAADVNSSADFPGEEQVLSMNDEEATALLAKEFGPSKKEEKQEVATQAEQTPSEVGVSAAIGALSEAQIPVLTETKKTSPEVASNPVRKVVLSLGIILAAILGTVYAARRWIISKKTSTPTTQIRVITQHYLGPRKSLAIVYVAGESLLIGITDSQINLVKQLSLIDDEIPNDLPRRFNDSLESAESVQPEPGENFSMKGLRDLVSGRLKNMREI